MLRDVRGERTDWGTPPQHPSSRAGAAIRCPHRFGSPGRILAPEHGAELHRLTSVGNFSVFSFAGAVGLLVAEMT